MSIELKELCNLDDENRSNYLVKKEMKQVWNVELNLLDKLLSVCKKYNLNVLCDSGTLLGAVRHGGFIPWDDDVDVIMPRDDFTKLIEISKKEFLSPFFFQSFYSEHDYYSSIAKLRMDDTAFFSKTMDCFKENIHYGIFIDIFPIDQVPFDYEKRTKVILEHNKIIKLLKFRNNRRLRLFYREQWKKLYKENKELLTKSDDQLFEYLNEVINTTENSEYCSDLSLEKSPRDTFLLSKDIFNQTEYVNFENMKVPISSKYEDILSTYYGDWKIPIKYPSLHGTTEDKVYSVDKSYKELIKPYEKLSYFVMLYLQKKIKRTKNKIAFFKAYLKLYYLLKFKTRSMKCVLWGKSSFLISYFERVKQNENLNNVIGIVDKACSKRGDFIKTIPIYPLQCLKELKPDVIVITITNNQSERYNEVMEYLSNTKLECTIVCV